MSVGLFYFQGTNPSYCVAILHNKTLLHEAITSGTQTERVRSPGLP